MLVKRTAVVVGDLHAPQVVLVLDALGVHRVPPFAVAVPDVHRDPGERGSAVGEVAERELEGQRDAAGGAGGDAEAGTDVAAHDAVVLQHVGSVGAVAGKGPAVSSGISPFDAVFTLVPEFDPRLLPSGGGCARSQSHAEGAEADSAQDRSAVKQCLYVEPEALVLELLRGARQQPATPRCLACVPTAQLREALLTVGAPYSRRGDEPMPAIHVPSVLRAKSEQALFPTCALPVWSTPCEHEEWPRRRS